MNIKFQTFANKLRVIRKYNSKMAGSQVRRFAGSTISTTKTE